MLSKLMQITAPSTLFFHDRQEKVFLFLPYKFYHFNKEINVGLGNDTGTVETEKVQKQTELINSTLFVA